MHHSHYAIRLLAEQRSSELIAEAERLNQLDNARCRRRRGSIRSLLARFRSPGPGSAVIDLREPPPPQPERNPVKQLRRKEDRAAPDASFRLQR